MKLPSQPQVSPAADSGSKPDGLSNQQSASGSVSSTKQSPQSSQTTRATEVQARQTLSNLNQSWVKVIASETLSPEQSRQALLNAAITDKKLSLEQQMSNAVKQGEVSQSKVDPSNTKQPPINTTTNSAANTTTAEQKRLTLLTLQPTEQLLKENLQDNLKANTTQQALIKLLSIETYQPGQLLKVQQDSNGGWALLKPSSSFSLHDLAQQHVGLSSKPLSLLSDLAGSNRSVFSQLLNTLNIQLPKLPLSSDVLPNAESVKQGVSFSGQFLESNLKSLQQLVAQQSQTGQGTQQTSVSNLQLPGQPLNLLPADLQKALAQASLNASSNQSSMPNVSGSPSQASSPNQINNPNQPAVTNSASAQGDVSKLNAQLKKVEGQIQKWVQQLQGSSADSATKKAHQTNQTQPTNTVQSANAVQTTSNLNTVVSGPALNQQDMKAWLINTQNQLANQLLTSSVAPSNKSSYSNQGLANSTFTSPLLIPTTSKQNENFIWSVLNSAGSNSDLKASLNKLAPLLTMLLQIKPPAVDGNQPTWPSNLSAQQQLNQVLQTQLPTMMGADKDLDDALRLLLNLNQQLSRVQSEQIQQRFVMQQNPEMNNMQFSLPYLHQSQVQWCQLEYRQEHASEEQKEVGINWHLILRFAQHEENGFAIESQMLQNRLNITLWAHEQNQLLHLNKSAPILQKRLNQAGFNVDQIQSKHGMPPVKQNAISQSLVDIRT